MNITFKKFNIKIILILMIVVISACSSPEDKANKFYENGMQLLEKGELVKANVEFRNALQLNRKMTKAIWGQVLISEKQGQPRQQYKLLNAVLINEPDHLQALVKLGRLLLLAGQLDKSLEMSDKSMKINNKDLSVLSLRASILLKLDDKKMLLN
jgi:tetratricopeptide (TPR) repeat protein